VSRTFGLDCDAGKLGVRHTKQSEVNMKKITESQAQQVANILNCEVAFMFGKTVHLCRVGSGSSMVFDVTPHTDNMGTKVFKPINDA
jgi:spore maturation protein SpmA